MMAATPNKVGVNISQRNWKVLVGPSQKKIDASNMAGLYLSPVW